MPDVDAAAIESLYRAHGHAVLRRARRLLGNEDEARDVLQEIFASLLDGASWHRGEGQVTTWLYSATTNGCLNRLRNQKTRLRLLENEHQGRAERVDNSDIESHLMVRELLANVPENLVVIAIHYYVDEMTQDEIAEVLGCSRRHVGDLLERLHARVRAVEVAE